MTMTITRNLFVILPTPTLRCGTWTFFVIYRTLSTCITMRMVYKIGLMDDVVMVVIVVTEVIVVIVNTPRLPITDRCIINY
jgi:hypothetical protein